MGSWLALPAVGSIACSSRGPSTKTASIAGEAEREFLLNFLSNTVERAQSFSEAWEQFCMLSEELRPMFIYRKIHVLLQNGSHGMAAT